MNGREIYTKLKRKVNKYKILSYHQFYPQICNLLDKRINRHIVIIESDDWGSIRVPSREVRDYFISKGIDMNSHPFERLDSLEMDSDLEELYEVLLSYNDAKGKHPIITANSLVANPDFSEIKDSEYSKYFYELTTQTYSKYPFSNNVPHLIKKGLELQIFYPQSHGREHFRIKPWLIALQSDKKYVRDAFNHGMCVCFPNDNKAGNDLMYALRYSDESEKQYNWEILKDGLHLFEHTYGYKSISYVAPCYTWPQSYEKLLFDKGIRMIQTERACMDTDHNEILYHYSGEHSTNVKMMTYSLRNCYFEPSVTGNLEEWKKCLTQVRSAFNSHKIAVISSHRINYVSRIEQCNRDNSLCQLNLLLKSIMKEWPDVEFMSSAQLYNEIYY